MLAVEREKGFGGGAIPGQAGDGVDQLVALLSGDFSKPLDAADLRGTRPVDITDELAGCCELALLDPPVALVDCSGGFPVSWRTVPDRR
jgi:hypothetical protein